SSRVCWTLVGYHILHKCCTVGVFRQVWAKSGIPFGICWCPWGKYKIDDLGSVGVKRYKRARNLLSCFPFLQSPFQRLTQPNPCAFFSQTTMPLLKKKRRSSAPLDQAVIDEKPPILHS